MMFLDLSPVGGQMTAPQDNLNQGRNEYSIRQPLYLLNIGIIQQSKVYQII